VRVRKGLRQVGVLARVRRAARERATPGEEAACDFGSVGIFEPRTFPRERRAWSVPASQGDVETGRFR